jgi:hypothetical protein
MLDVDRDSGFPFILFWRGLSDSRRLPSSGRLICLLSVQRQLPDSVTAQAKAASAPGGGGGCIAVSAHDD